ncbi:MAG TPA: hypothetical protein VGE74_08800 [Gemmata sp.]
MSIRLSCPSCNHTFALPALPESRRALCPRCQDVFPIRTFTELPDEGSVFESPAKVIDVRPRRLRGLLIGSGVALLLIVVGAGWVLYDIGRGMSGLGDDPPGAPPATAESATQLVGLNYLRANSNIVFAVRMGPLLAHAERTQQQPGEVLKQTGLPDVFRGGVEQLGVPLAQIDHVAGGLELGEGENALRLALVLVLKGPLANEDEFLRKLKARPVANKKGWYDLVLGRFPLLAERVSPTVWVFGLTEKDFSAVATGGHGPGGAQFRGDDRSGPRGLIATLPQDAAVWAVADDDSDWAQKPIAKLLGTSAEMKRWLSAVKDGRGGSLAVSLGEQPRVKLRVRAADTATGERVRAYFAARAQETPSARTGGEGAVAEFESPFNPETGKMLQRFLSDAAK